MSSYDPEDDGYGTAKTIGAAVLGGLAGRTVGRAAGGKVGKLAKNGSRTAKQLRAAKLANAGTAGGAAGAATLANLDDESVRDTLNRVIEARDATGYSDPKGSYLIYGATRAIPAVLAGRVLMRGGKMARKAIKSGKTPSQNETMKFAKQSGKQLAAGAGVATVGNYWYPKGDDQ